MQKKLDESGQTNVQLLQMVRMEKKKRVSGKATGKHRQKGKAKQKKQFQQRMMASKDADAAEANELMMIGTNPMMAMRKKKKDKITVHTDKKSGRKFSYHHGTKERKWLPKEDAIYELDAESRSSMMI